MEKAVVVTCMDHRLHGKNNVVKEFINELGIEDYYLISNAGGILDLVEPRGKENKLLADIKLAVEHGGARKIFLINHEDCAAYGERFKFASKTHERRFHFRHLRRAEQIIRGKFSFPLQVFPLFGVLEEGKFKVKSIHSF